MRIAPGKDDCLVLDFAGNVMRHGPVDAIALPEEKKGKGDGEAAEPPAKICPGCDAIVPIGTRECPDCGHVFPPPEPKIEATATTEAIMVLTARDEWQEVRDVDYRRHRKPGAPDSLRVDYLVGAKVVSEWVCVEHSGYAREKAVAWWELRGDEPTARHRRRGARAHGRAAPARRGGAGAGRQVPPDQAGAVRGARGGAGSMTPERRPVAAPPYPCAVCNRASAGFAFSAPQTQAPPVFFCSMHCSEVWMVAHRKKIELTRDEAAAALAGGKAAGAFLEQLGRTDMGQLSRVEWAEFCERLTRGYLEELQRQADAQVPF